MPNERGPLRSRWPELVSALGSGAAGLAAFFTQDTLRLGLGAGMFLAAGGGIGIAIGRRRWSKPDNQRAANLFVAGLHRRWFPDPSPVGMNADYRVSLFAPTPSHERPTAWVRLARTGDGGNRAPKPWPVPAEPGERATAGLVVNTALDRSAKEVVGVPSARREKCDANAAEHARYLREAALDEATHKARSWRWATLRTCPVAATSTGTIRWVVVIERESGLPIESDQHMTLNPDKTGWQEIDRNDFELQLVSEVLGAAWEAE